MFGFEPWFIYAILSAITGGIYIFTTKVAVERGYNGVVFNTIGSFVSAVILLSLTGFIAGYEWLSWYALLFVALNAVLYMIGNLVRYDALGCIDTAIFYPLYKTLSPILAIAAGVYLFSESFTQMEWVGLLFSLTVPLLLISSQEKSRQRNLSRGLFLLVVAAILATLSAVALKLGTQETTNMWMFSALAHSGLVLVGTTLLLRKQSPKALLDSATKPKDSKYMFLMGIMGINHAFSFVFFMLALSQGTLALVYTIQSLYILIPIVLSVIFYNEHWNYRKIMAIVISIAALGLLK
jgi:uncharacterized membrane protein